MNKHYHFLTKKSIFSVFCLFLFLPLSLFAKTPNDPEYYQQKDFWNLINLEKAWDFTTGSSKVVIAVIDTGVDIHHRDLVNNIWHNPYEIPSNGIDDDSNGYVDDINGWNFIENNNDVRTSVFDNSDDPEAVRHGTLVAGLIGAQGDNYKNGTGVNWDINIMPLRAVSSNGFGSLEDIVKAINYAVNNGAMVISLSVVGLEKTDSLENSLRFAKEKGVVIVAAAGNNFEKINSENYIFPACLGVGDDNSWVLGVGSIGLDGHISRFTNYGDCIDLYAPGEGIFSTERYAPQFDYDKEFGGPWAGTSFSTPMVAGAAALIKSIRPDWSSEEISKILLDSASVFYSNTTGYFKVLDVGAAIENTISDRSVIEPNFDFYYYFKNNEIRRRDRILRDRGMLARIPEAKIIDLSLRRNFVGVADLAVLFKRGQHYFVRFYKENGVWWHEFPLSTEKNGKIVFTPKKINWKDDGVEIYFSASNQLKKNVFYNRMGEKRVF